MRHSGPFGSRPRGSKVCHWVGSTPVAFGLAVGNARRDAFCGNESAFHRATIEQDDSLAMKTTPAIEALKKTLC